MSSLDDLPIEITHQVRDSCVNLHVQRAGRAVARRIDDALRPVGLTSGQYSLLMSLNRPAPPRMRDVANLLAMDRTTLTANLKPLERRGLLEVRTDEKDRRTRRLILTDEGRKSLIAAYPVWERVQAELSDLLRGRDLERLLADLRALS
jgi:DNA-binding MarR family transcriptional regulator